MKKMKHVYVKDVLVYEIESNLSQDDKLCYKKQSTIQWRFIEHNFGNLQITLMQLQFKNVVKDIADNNQTLCLVVV